MKIQTRSHLYHDNNIIIIIDNCLNVLCIARLLILLKLFLTYSYFHYFIPTVINYLGLSYIKDPTKIKLLIDPNEPFIHNNI